jgi:hypothetical protein
MKCYRLLPVVLILAALLLIANPALAIDLPDSTPKVISVDCYRNVLETGDYLAIIYENTPYTTIPDINYSESFIWRFMSTDGNTELAQALGYDYFDGGYGYNVISFYFSQADAPAWGQNYNLTLSGSPTAFGNPPKYNFQITSSAYSSAGAATVKEEIASNILLIAADLNNKWVLTSDESLLLEIETGTVLSIYGEAFFRGAIYGIQAIAPSLFRLEISNIAALNDRTWGMEYTSNLINQYSDTYIQPAMEAGNKLLDVDYNLFGILGTLAICALIIFANWYLAGGNLWRCFIEATPPLIISTRLGLWGMGELGLVAAIGWLYISSKVWKVI